MFYIHGNSYMNMSLLDPLIKNLLWNIMFVIFDSLFPIGIMQELLLHSVRNDIFILFLEWYLSYIYIYMIIMQQKEKQ